MIKLLETPEETTTKMPCLSGLNCLSEEDKRNNLSYVCDVYHDYYILICF